MADAELPRLRTAIGWLAQSRETQNFTYDISTANREHLAWFVANVCEKSVADCRFWVQEVLDDTALRSHIEDETERSRWRGISDRQARFGRRVGWYAFVRATRPDHVLETGTDKGLGSCVLAAALLRNGCGQLTTVDLNPNAGALISGPYAAVTTRLIGDSVAAIGGLSHTVDLFLHDSDHTPEHETAELVAVATHLTERSIALSDNSHWSLSLPQWAESTGRRFLYFDERPVRHWYPGGGIGTAYYVQPITA